MKCARVREKLNAYYDGEVNPEVRMQIEEHLRGCPECRQALDSLEQLGPLLCRTSIPPIPDGLASRIMAKAAPVLTGSTPDLRSSWRMVAWWQSVSLATRTAAAAMILVGLGLGLLMGRDTWQGQGPLSSLCRPGSYSDPLALNNLDYLTEAPAGSLPEVYLTLTTGESTGRK